MNTILVSRCDDCGYESVLFFGMFVPCKYNNGLHAHISDCAVDELTIARRLYAAYQCVPWFDRERFDKLPSNHPAKTLLSRYCPYYDALDGHIYTERIGFRGYQFSACECGKMQF